MSRIAELFEDIRSVRTLPRVSISLMASSAVGNDPFFDRMVHGFYREAVRRHARFPLVRNLQYGVALFQLPDQPEDYLQKLEGPARRNIRKAERLGYTFSRIDFNQRREEIVAIIRSTPVRQGPMASTLMTGEIPPISDPPSRSPLHDYLYAGVCKDGELRAYAGCLVAGELFAITDLYGHYTYQPDGIVPLLFVELVRYARARHPQARYCMYDKYFGASKTLRRFKRKFGFLPHKVQWRLD